MSLLTENIDLNNNFLCREQMTVSTLPLDRVHMESTAGGGADLVFRYKCSLKVVCHDNQGVSRETQSSGCCRAFPVG